MAGLVTPTAHSLRAAHARGLRRGLLPHQNQPLACRVLAGYSASGRLTDAVRVFDQIPSPDLISWTCLMNLHLRHGHPGPAAAAYRRIADSGLRPDGFAAVAAVSAAAGLGDLPLLGSLHGSALRLGLDRETAFCNSLVHAYARVGALPQARKLFDGMPSRDAISWGSILHAYAQQESTLHLARYLFDEMPQRSSSAWTVMISGFVRAGRPLLALETFREMVTAGGPGLEAIATALSACADAGALVPGRCVHGVACKTAEDAAITNALMDMYAKAGRPETAAVVFQERRNSMDVYAWTTMISGLAINGDGAGALRVFQGMLHAGVVPNAVTFVSVLSACAHAGLVQDGVAWFDAMRRDYGIQPRIEHYGCLIDLLGRAGRLVVAEEVIAGMEVEPDAVLWRSLLSACLVHGERRLAEMAARRVIELEPDDDGARVLLWNLYAEGRRWDDAGEIRETMKSRRIRKRPGKSWVELNGVVCEFLVDDCGIFQGRSELRSVLEGLEKHLRTHHDEL
ncbi:putative pentatricopeptide repeat-containing protein At3g49142 [Wolffia australiana]